ncbi:NAD(P)/FAD-dependent oxidoreductase [Stieleria sp. JC731]|uniref:dihydrolipoyl dehydrogenase family protein n=1 Tax=Pirellulaceae TaxID=2691357 RepID=UPI001E4FBF31|nr:NAD(P)/FAD-dependent oxidoreductase [Stieleria sp. JC731]MCC9600917.1 NAD(P)/FAD-dependent oxidoreductase [Stieleria sp. JC731]
MLKREHQHSAGASSSIETFDLVVLGSGPAAKSVAEDASESGHRVALVESRRFGGTCALRGCNPKKVLTNAALLLDRMRSAKGSLFESTEIKTDWKTLHRFQREFTDPVAENTESNLNDKGIATFQGEASFIDQNTIRVHSGRDDRTVKAAKFLIATGATPRPLDFAGSEFLTRSDQFLALEQIPKRILFVGGGYISMEFGHVACALGCEVTIVEQSEQLMKGFDPDLVEQLKAWSIRKGIRFQTGARIESIHHMNNGSLEIATDGKDVIHADMAVHGAGRIPNIQSLNLESAGIEYSDDGIQVDSFLRSTNCPHVFAAGDCADNGGAMLTPVANEDAYVVSKNLFADEPSHRPDYKGIASAAFTCPPIASVGCSERQARQDGYEIDVHKRDTSTWGSVRKTGLPCAGYKVIVDRSNDQILGAHLLGVGAEDQINLFALAIKHGIDTRAIKSMPFAYPTLTADLKRMV